MHIDFALPAGGDLAAGFARYQAAAAKSVMDYSFHMAVTSWDAKACCPFTMPVQECDAQLFPHDCHGTGCPGAQPQLQVVHHNVYAGCQAVISLACSASTIS